ncbi:hypothetical protein [Propionivibrio sp.]|uniref:hypothetical protein n=1 Tax=Propionivibrio sp. TaxID=2212460 RepID=UPI0025F51A68|nr:hypothetical protein [Propionivibrio sp.]MBK8745319.1 hypothetical protein [Propionivibrio sp.]
MFAPGHCAAERGIAARFERQQVAALVEHRHLVVLHRSVRQLNGLALPVLDRVDETRGKPPGRRRNIADRLILMGDWRDSFAAMT